MRRIAALATAGLACVLAGCGSTPLDPRAEPAPSAASSLSAAPPAAADNNTADIHDSEATHLGAMADLPETTAGPALARPSTPQHATAVPRTSTATVASPAPSATPAPKATDQHSFTAVPARGPQLVMARPGMSGVHPVRWESAQALSDRTVRVSFTGGAAPCDVLDSVRVDYRADAVAITLFSGSDPAQPDRMCAAVTHEQAVDVQLADALAGRHITDGAAPTATPTPPSTDPASGPDAGAAPVIAEHNTADAHPVPWEQAKVIGPQLVRIYYTSGVAPCSVLDHVRVTWTAGAAVITLFQGHVPSRTPQMCPMIARRVYVDVMLDRPLDGRQITDGAAN